MYHYDLIREYRRDLELTAHHHRLLRQAQVGNPTRLSTVMVWTGRRLVAAGQFLQAHSQVADMPTPRMSAGSTIH
jgi:hypothetical protein